MLDYDANKRTFSAPLFPPGCGGRLSLQNLVRLNMAWRSIPSIMMW